MSAESVATTRYARSLNQIERARRTIPGGVATAMRAAQRPVPLVIERAAGSRMVDVDGNEYVDYVLGFGPMLLGHSPPEVIEAVREQLGRGFTYRRPAHGSRPRSPSGWSTPCPAPSSSASRPPAARRCRRRCGSHARPPGAAR